MTARRVLAGALAALGLLSLPTTTGADPLTGAAGGVAVQLLTAADATADAESVGFLVERTRESLVGSHARGRQFRDGVPIDGTELLVHTLNDGTVAVERRASSLPGAAVADPISREAALLAAQRELGLAELLAPPSAERLLVARDGGLVDVWRVTVTGAVPPVAATVDVGAATGTVLAVTDRRRFDDVRVTVFDPSPMVTARDPSLRQPAPDRVGVDADLDSDALTAELRQVDLLDYDPVAITQGKLVGPWVNVQAPAPIGVDGDFEYTRSDPRFEAQMAYVHLDRLQRYFQTLGFTGSKGVNAEPQDVYALPLLGYDQSFYQSGNDLIVFGAGGVDDGEDAEVILHEYGHAVQDAQVPGWGRHHEGGAMGEGFGDFLAAAYYARTSNGFQDACVAEWDATSYSSSSPPCLRRVDGTKKYPADMANQVHDDGEIWSAFLWRLRPKLIDPENPTPDPVEASDNAIRLVLASHELLGTSARFADGVAALRTAATQLGHPEWVPLVDAAADVHGLAGA